MCASPKLWGVNKAGWDGICTERKRNSMCESLQPFCHPLQECRVISYQVICAVLTALDGNNTFLRDWHELCPLLPAQDILLTSVLLFLPMLTQQYSFFFEFLSYQFFHLCSWDCAAPLLQGGNCHYICLNEESVLEKQNCWHKSGVCI